MIVIVAGVSGSGKTTVGGLLAARLGWPFVDGDSLHPGSNVAKMASGVPLTDEDRMPWLAAIGEWIDAQLARDQPGVVACSALKRSYRALLLDERPSVRMAFLLIDHEVCTRRMAARKGHFFSADLLASQFAVLEPPSADEPRVVLVPVFDRPGTTADEIVRRLHLITSITNGGRI
jgi:carbohydrate kinase (thermoresistant glucokinase family)